MARVILTVEERDKFNRTFADKEERNLLMSIYSSIKYWQDKESGFLNFSLDSLFKEKYKNKFYTSLSNFVKKARELYEKGFLRVKSRGRLNFYGTSNCKSSDEIREENEKLREENNALNEEVERLKKELEEFKREVIEKLHSASKEEVKEEKIENERVLHEVVSQEVVIETAYEMMEEVGIEKGSTVFMQVIESLYTKTDKEPVHIKGFVNYIKKVIHNKVHNQSMFKKMLRNERKNPSIFMTKAEEQKYINLERELLGFDI